MRGTLLAVTVVFALVAAACADPAGGGGASGTTEPPPFPVGFPVTIEETGGCFQMGPNCARYEVAADGTVTAYRVGAEDEGPFGVATLTAETRAALVAALAATDLDDLASRLGPGTCNACVDGIDLIVAFTTDGATKTFDSAAQDFDQTEPLFAAIAAAWAEAAAALPIPIETRDGVGGPIDESAAIYGATVRQIVEVDNSFGGEHPFTTILVVDHIDPDVAEATGGDPAGRPLTEAERAAILDAIGYLDVQFVASAEEWRTDDLMPVIEDSAIVTVGEIVADGEDRLVGMSLWCGGVCGIWLTYRVTLEGATWTVDGIEGPIAIS